MGHPLPELGHGSRRLIFPSVIAGLIAVTCPVRALYMPHGACFDSLREIWLTDAVHGVTFRKAYPSPRACGE